MTVWSEDTMGLMLTGHVLSRDYVRLSDGSNCLSWKAEHAEVSHATAWILYTPKIQCPDNICKNHITTFLVKNLFFFQALIWFSLPTNSMEQSAYWEANKSKATQIPRFMVPDGSSPHSQENATCPYPEPDRSSLCPPSNLPSTPGSSKWSPSFRFPQQTPLHMWYFDAKVFRNTPGVTIHNMHGKGEVIPLINYKVRHVRAHREVDALDHPFFTWLWDSGGKTWARTVTFWSQQTWLQYGNTHLSLWFQLDKVDVIQYRLGQQSSQVSNSYMHRPIQQSILKVVFALCDSKYTVLYCTIPTGTKDELTLWRTKWFRR
jgi:hypothetical protein